MAAYLNPVSDPLVVGLVLQESVQLFAELLSTEDLLLTDFLWLHLLSCGELHFLNYVTKKIEEIFLLVMISLEGVCFKFYFNVNIKN